MGEHVDVELLVERAKEGDADAFGALYDRFVEPLHRFIRFRVGGESDAEDLTQLVFLKMIEALPRYETRGIPFRAWLFRLARNAVIDFHRTSHPHQAIDELVEHPAGTPDPETAAGLALERRRLREALGNLTREQQEVVALRFFGGLTTSEVGQAIGKREGTVRGLQFRAIEALRRRLEEP